MTTPSGGRHTEREIIDSRQEYDILIPPPTLVLQQPYLKIASCLSAFVCVVHAVSLDLYAGFGEGQRLSHMLGNMVVSWVSYTLRADLRMC